MFSAAASGEHPALLQSWGGALAYTLQLYFDFSGYSDMAVGLSRMFGVKLPLNFDSPYKATNIIEFWRRWHMTLSRFLRDYLYIPLGGNRKGQVRRYASIMITMLLGGLWHGAAWNFVLWGGLHGLYLMINHAWRRFRDPLDTVSRQPLGTAGSQLTPSRSLQWSWLGYFFARKISMRRRGFWEEWPALTASRFRTRSPVNSEPWSWRCEPWAWKLSMAEARRSSLPIYG